MLILIALAQVLLVTVEGKVLPLNIKVYLKSVTTTPKFSNALQATFGENVFLKVILKLN